MSIKLYGYWRSSCSWRVRTALELKEVKYEYIAVDLSRGEQRNEFKRINPMGQVPTLVVGDQYFTQSLPVVEYIDEKFPGLNLFPTDLNLKTKTRSICEAINSGIQPLHNPSVMGKVPEKERKEWGYHWVKNGFVAIEKMLKETAGKYSVGEDVTAADIFLIPQVSVAIHRFKVDMSEFPIISRVYAALEKHEAFVAAHPYQQPDTPENPQL